MSKKLIFLAASLFVIMLFLVFQRAGQERCERCPAFREQTLSVTEINNRHAIELYPGLRKHSDEENTFFSPYSLLTALIMTYEGARGLTEEEIRRAFYLPEKELGKTLLRGKFRKTYYQ